MTSALEQRVRVLAEQLVQVRSELRRAEERIAALTITDDATGLLNARAFHDRALLEVERANRYDRPAALAVIEPEDPAVLPALSEICRAQCRSVDLAGRIDGSAHIVLLLPETALPGALVIADRICATARRQSLAASAGCAAFPVHGRVFARLLAAARHALARARAAGTTVRSVAAG